MHWQLQFLPETKHDQICRIHNKSIPLTSTMKNKTKSVKASREELQVTWPTSSDPYPVQQVLQQLAHRSKASSRSEELLWFCGRDHQE